MFFPFFTTAFCLLKSSLHFRELPVTSDAGARRKNRTVLKPTWETHSSFESSLKDSDMQSVLAIALPEIKKSSIFFYSTRYSKEKQGAAGAVVTCMILPLLAATSVRWEQSGSFTLSPNLVQGEPTVQLFLLGSSKPTFLYIPTFFSYVFVPSS